jgi:hypothetical protein
VSGWKSLSKLLDGMEKFAGNIKHSDLDEFCTTLTRDGTVLPREALRSLKTAKYDMANPDMLLRLIKKGIRFELWPFVEEIDVTENQLEDIFPLMNRPLWPKDDLLRHCVTLHTSGRAPLADAIQQLPQVKEFYNSLPPTERLLDHGMELHLKRGHLSWELLGRFLSPSER